MRWQHLFIWPLCLLIWRWLPLEAQEKKDTSTHITEVGGRSLEYWIRDIPSKDQSRSENAIGMVLMFGPERAYQALPAIMDRLRKHNPSTNSFVDASVRVKGVMVLGAILGSYKEASAKDIKEAVAILKRYSSDSESIVRFRTMQALGSIGEGAKAALPEVITNVSYRHAFETRHAAVVALGQIAFDKVNGPSLEVLNALYVGLADPAVTVRLASIQTITALGGPVDPKLRLSLFKALEPVCYKDSDPGVKVWAHMAVMSIKREVEKGRVDAIAGVLKDPDAGARVQALQALGTIGKDAKQTIPLLMKGLNDQDVPVVAWSIWALGKMGPSAGVALPALERIKGDMTQPEIQRRMAEDSIELINGKKK